MGPDGKCKKWVICRDALQNHLPPKPRFGGRWVRLRSRYRERFGSACGVRAGLGWLRVAARGRLNPGRCRGGIGSRPPRRDPPGSQEPIRGRCRRGGVQSRRITTWRVLAFFHGPFPPGDRLSFCDRPFPPRRRSLLAAAPGRASVCPRPLGFGRRAAAGATAAGPPRPGGWPCRGGVQPGDAPACPAR